MKHIAAVDIGNSTTEVCLARQSDNGEIKFLASASVFTTGLKGTIDNVAGILNALEQATAKAAIQISDLSIIRINEAAPVIGGAAMETITKTVVTESSMLGHNPKTPAGFGAKCGESIRIEYLDKAAKDKPYIVLADASFNYEAIAKIINNYTQINIVGAVLQADEAVLVHNRLDVKIPIIDEVRLIEKMKEGVQTAIEVALPGQTIRMLSNPYGIATLLKLTPDETERVLPIAKSLMGARSAVVMKTPWDGAATHSVKAGKLRVTTEDYIEIDVDHGAKAIMQAVDSAGKIENIDGEEGTNIGEMLSRVVGSMDKLKSGDEPPRIKDIFAADTFAPMAVSGALAGETSLEKAVAVAAMVTAGKLPMQAIAKALSAKTHIFTTVSGVEAVQAALGALTTPGAKLPLAVLDLGGGSTDAAVIDENGTVGWVCLAGAGELVTLMIQTELGLASRITAENIKKHPAAKVESLFHIRLESGEVIFFEEGIDPKFFGTVVLLSPSGMIKIDEDINIEKIVATRKEAKQKVFVENAMRAVRKLSAGTVPNMRNVVLVGGSAEDFEIPEFISAAFANAGIVCGRGNIRGSEGARNAVATGLVASYIGWEEQSS